MSLDPIRAYSDLQVNPWEDTEFFERNSTGNLLTIPAFAGRYEYEFNFWPQLLPDGVIRISVGPAADNKYIGYWEKNNNGEVQVSGPYSSRLVISKIENPINIIVTIATGAGGTIFGNYRRRELRIL